MSELSAGKELERIKEEQAELDQIREGLAQKCSQLDHRHWIKRNYLMGIGSGSLDLKDSALKMTEWLGGTQEYYLTRNGRIFMGLEHHEDLESDDRVYFPEILREATLAEYRQYSPWAFERLELIEKVASQKDFLETDPEVYDLGSLVTIRPLSARG